MCPCALGSVARVVVVGVVVVVLAELFLSAYTSRLLPPASIYTSTTAVRGTVRWLIHLCL